MQRRRLAARAVLGGLVPALLALSIAPAIAQASVSHYCVQNGMTAPAACPTGFTQVYYDIGTAVATLGSDDTVQIEPGTYVETPVLQNVTGVTIAGDPAQSAAPVITASTSSATGGVFTVGAGADGVVLKHLEIDQTYPPNASYPADAVTINSPATLDGVTINSTGRALQTSRPVTLTNVSAKVAEQSPPPPSGPQAAVNLDGHTGSMVTSYGTIAATNLTVSAPKFPFGVQVANDAGVSIDGANITALGNTTGEASAALDVSTATNGPIAISHARLAGSVYGLYADAGALTVSNTLATAAGPGATDPGSKLFHLTSAGIAVVPATAAGASIRNVTAIASDPSASGIETNGQLTVGSETLPAGSISVVNSIARGGAHDLLGAPPVAPDLNGGVVNVSYTNYRQSSRDGTAPGLGVQSGDPGFVDAARANYHVQAGSPAVDAGALVASGDLDLDGMPRPDDSAGLPDLGAYEYPSPPPGAIAGTVTDAAGQPISGATVTVYGLSGNTVTAQIAGLAGTYTAAGLPPGSYRVGFAANGYDPQFYNGKSSLAGADPVVVAPGATTTGINASLSRRPGGVRGTVRNDKGSAIAGATVTAYDASGLSVATASSDAAGGFEIDQLAPGAYRVGFSADRYVSQFFNHAATLAQADAINVTSGSVSPGIDAVLALAGGSGPPLPSLRARTLQVSPMGSFSLMLGGCPAECRGTITVTAAPGARSAVNQGAGRKSSRVVIARGTYKLAPGKRAVIKLHLNRAGTRLRRRHQALLVARVVLTAGSSTSTTPVRLVPASKKRSVDVWQPSAR